MFIARVLVPLVLFSFAVGACGSDESEPTPCPEGTLGCICHAGGTCDGEGTRCDFADGICIEGTIDCPEGTLDCPCSSAGVCAQGLICDRTVFASGLCKNPPGR